MGEIVLTFNKDPSHGIRIINIYAYMQLPINSKCPRELFCKRGVFIHSSSRDYARDGSVLSEIVSFVHPDFETIRNSRHIMTSETVMYNKRVEVSHGEFIRWSCCTTMCDKRQDVPANDSYLYGSGFVFGGRRRYGDMLTGAILKDHIE